MTPSKAAKLTASAPVLFVRDVYVANRSQLHRPLPANRFAHLNAIEDYAQASGDHRTSFAPETAAARRNKHDGPRQIFRKINANDPCSAAHDDLVANERGRLYEQANLLQKG